MTAPKLNPALGIPALRHDKHGLRDLGVGVYEGPQARRKTDWQYVGEICLNALMATIYTVLALALVALGAWRFFQ